MPPESACGAQSRNRCTSRFHNIEYTGNIVTLQKTRWQGEGCIPAGNITLFYVGITTNEHANGVGILVHDSLILYMN